ncbi:magnesium chelatase ATPase subunit D [Limihaloglobus sulfuriphilus]|uniref:Magnesium chelatase ATPase subunit D n=1 Tax=Limihaloglobus sulfuriphilus TaxID=1851148 RepID=A0A1Q2MHC2_9BACT|nr:MoxR family ATPase [Limihaloglobus sulfuriphilus]AQQ72105.1 magnesium chelatase ATPase subunit D [Limihaloglobus sulfuriphilus]
MALDISEITRLVEQKSSFVKILMAELDKVIVGQQYMLERMLIALLSNGHILLEGVPGLAKTTAVTALAGALSSKFQRIQFTPDLLPADLTGTQIYRVQDGEFITRMGPIFANIILADEINRAPAKVQSALLEAMQEKQVTIGEQTYPLPRPFLVLATQNPIEQEGTYPLPEAQLDRFMLKIKIEYPSKDEERRILDLMSATSVDISVNPVISPDDIIAAREVVDSIYVDEKIKDYIVDVVFATRDPKAYGIDELAAMINFGASPRATIALTIAARAHAFIRGRGYVTPQDIKSIGMDVLRHRVIPSYEAEAQEKTSEDIIQTIFDNVDVP